MTCEVPQIALVPGPRGCSPEVQQLCPQEHGQYPPNHSGVGGEVVIYVILVQVRHAQICM